MMLHHIPCIDNNNDNDNDNDESITEITVVSLHSHTTLSDNTSSLIDDATIDEATSWTMVTDNDTNNTDGGYINLASVKIDSMPSSGSIIEERERRLALMLRENAPPGSDWAVTVRHLLKPDSTMTIICDNNKQEGEGKKVITRVKIDEYNDNNSAVNLSDLITEESVIISSSPTVSVSACLQRRTSLDDLVRTVLKDMGCAEAAASSVAGSVSGRGRTSVADIKDLEGLCDNTSMESLLSLCRRHPLTTALLASIIVYHVTVITASLVKRRRRCHGSQINPRELGGVAYHRSMILSTWIKTKINTLLSTKTTTRLSNKGGYNNIMTMTMMMDYI